MARNVRVESRLHPNASRTDREREAFQLMRRFKRACDDVEVLRDLKDHQFYQKPCERRKRKRLASLITLRNAKKESQ